MEVPDKLKQVVGKLNEYRRPGRKNVYNSPPIISKSQNNILVINSTALGTIGVLAIFLMAVKYFKLNSVVKGL